MDLPPELILQLQGQRLEPVRTGESGAHVWKCIADGPARYLKAGPVSAHLHLHEEADRLRWMRSRQLPVPPVVRYINAGAQEYLLTEEASGQPASAAAWKTRQADVARALGKFLGKLHRADATGCPFDRRICVQLEEARVRIAQGNVREDDFDAARRGRTASDLFEELLTLVPGTEDLVLVHGDFCLPNVLLSVDAPDALHVTGLIDCGRAGVGDRHQDLALAIRSLTHNFGSDAVAPFLAAYGEFPVDPSAIEFFTILDEFF